MAQKVALAGTYWQKGKCVEDIAGRLGVSERQIYHYINRWLYHRKEVLDLIAFVVILLLSSVRVRKFHEIARRMARYLLIGIGFGARVRLCVCGA